MVRFISLTALGYCLVGSVFAVKSESCVECHGPNWGYSMNATARGMKVADLAAIKEHSQLTAGELADALTSFKKHKSE